MSGPSATYLSDGRLHLHHGPIDLILSVEPINDADREAAYRAAVTRFGSILEELVAELPELRRQLTQKSPAFRGPVARRMRAAALPLCQERFVTAMIAVAGAVADEILLTLTDAGPLRRAYVNNGGDIALHLTDHEAFSVAMSAADGQPLGHIHLTAEDRVGGIATSGQAGRSHSLGIADSVTVLAATAATADAAATLIANAVDIPQHPGIERQPANVLSPDSDLGQRLVVVSVPPLTYFEARSALEAGAALARQMIQAGQITGAALFLQGQSELVGSGFSELPKSPEAKYA